MIKICATLEINFIDVEVFFFLVLCRYLPDTNFNLYPKLYILHT